MYYSIYIETSGLIHSIVSLDEPDLEKIKNSVVLPFLKNEFFFVNGNKLREKDVKVIKVVSTDAPIKKSLKLKKSMKFSPDEISDICDVIYDVDDITNDLFDEVKKELKNKISDKKENLTYDKKKVFVVHGHDEKLKLEVENFLIKLGLKPVILSEQANEGQTIIEKIDSNTNVGYGIVLYTPCDKGGTKDTDFASMKFRARQNVILEHGYLMGKLGRKKVCALVDGDIEFPSDIQGIVYVPYQNDWKIKIIKELNGCGYDVDANEIFK